MNPKVSMRITCPHCRHILVVDRNKGDVLSVHAPVEPGQAAADPFEQALTRIRRAQETADDRFEASKKAALTRDADADQKFLQALEEAKKDPDAASRPIRDIDLE